MITEGKIRLFLNEFGQCKNAPNVSEVFVIPERINSTFINKVSYSEIRSKEQPYPGLGVSSEVSLIPL